MSATTSERTEPEHPKPVTSEGRRVEAPVKEAFELNDKAGEEPIETFQPEELGTPSPIAADPETIAQNVEALDEPAAKTLRPTTVTIAATALVLTVISAFVFGMRATIGVAVGGLLATVNFILFIRLVSAFLSQKGNTAPWAVLAGVKLLGLFAFVYIVLKRGELPAMALALGYASLPIGISLGTLVKPRSPGPADPKGPLPQ